MGREVTAAVNPVEARFLCRLNRFTVLAEVEGEKFKAYLPNSGRLLELLNQASTLILDRAKAGRRKTQYTVVGAITPEGVRVSVDARLPNRLMAELLRQGELEEFKGFRLSRSEPRLGKGRVDFLLEGFEGKLLLEVKSCTLTFRGGALFPDAPTLRGRRHLLELARAVESGWKAAVVFLAQRGDVEEFQPNWREDPEFTRALKEAWRKGVKVYAYKAEFDGRKLKLLGRIPALV